MIQCIFVGIGGFIGAVCRYLMGLLPLGSEMAFPIKTFIVNLLGAFLIGLIAAFAVKYNASNSNWVLMLKVGVCGGFTTFSTFAFEMADLMKGGQHVTAVIYGAGSMILGIALIALAQWIVYVFVK